MDARDLFNCYTASNEIFSMLDPATGRGQLLWSRKRKQMEFPDPAILGKTDYDCLKIYFSEVCSFCQTTDLPCKTISWKLGGIRFCFDCFKAHTIPDRYLWQSADIRYYKFVSFEDNHPLGRKMDDPWQRVCLRSDIRDHIPTEEEMRVLKERYEAVETFDLEFRSFKYRLNCSRNEHLNPKSKRLRDVQRLIFSEFPALDGYNLLWNLLPSYNRIRHRKCWLIDQTSRMQFLDQIKNDMEKHHDRLLDFRMKKCIDSVFPGDRNLAAIIELPEYKALQNSIKTLPTNDEAMALLKPVFEIYGEIKRQNKLKMRTYRRPRRLGV